MHAIGIRGEHSIDRARLPHAGIVVMATVPGPGTGIRKRLDCAIFWSFVPLNVKSLDSWPSAPAGLSALAPAAIKNATTTRRKLVRPRRAATDATFMISDLADHP